ncbi:MAG: HAD hydrolase family protein [Planctomycetes bacterium]|nr:HAD hydrolase family protein [Planctomycetota bacterium]MBI3834662.1 HAD hydrolase family protein [Planctomycetota bacterium]
MKEIRLLVLDVDGVLTDGTIRLDKDGDHAKAFHVRDGWAIKKWLRQGGQIALISGRKSPEVRERARELGIEWVREGVSDKGAALDTLVTSIGMSARDAAFVGDDIPDLDAMRLCGFAVAVADASPTVKRVAGFVTRSNGGHGAVAEVIELLLRKENRWLPAARSNESGQ